MSETTTTTNVAQKLIAAIVVAALVAAGSAYTWNYFYRVPGEDWNMCKTHVLARLQGLPKAAKIVPGSIGYPGFPVSFPERTTLRPVKGPSHEDQISLLLDKYVPRDDGSETTVKLPPGWGCGMADFQARAWFDAKGQRVDFLCCYGDDDASIVIR